MTISIIGCGWLGLPLGQHLHGLGHVIKGSTTTQSKREILAAVGIEPFVLNLSEGEVSGLRQFLQADILIVNIPPRDNGKSGSHLQQLQTLANSAIAAVKNVLFISSTGVYPNLNREVTEEDASPTARSRGGVVLLDAENTFRSTRPSDVTVLRLAGLYGPDRHPGRFMAGRKDLPGGDNPVNMVHLADCIWGITAVIEKGLWGRTFNLCSPTHPARRDFYEQAAKELGVAPPHFSEAAADYKKVSAQRFIEATDYKFQY